MVNGLPIPTPQESSIEVFLRVVKEFTNPRTRESFYVALALVLLASIVAAATQRSSYFIAALVVLYVIFVAALTIQNLAVFGDARNKDRTMHRRAAWNIVAIFIFIAVSIGAFITLNSSGLGTNLRILYHWYVTEDPFDKISSRSVNPIPVNINSTSELTKFKVNDFSKYGIEANQTFSKFNVKIPFHLMEQLSQNDKVVFSGNETINLTNVAGEGGLAIVASEIDFDDYAKVIIGKSQVVFIARKFVFGKHSSVAAFEDASPGKASVNAKGRDGQPAEAMALVFLTEKPQGKLFIDLRGQRGEDGGDGGYGDKPDDNDVPQKRLIGQHAKSEPITVKDFFERSFANIHNSKEFNADDKRKKKEQEATLLENKRLFMTQNCHGLAEPECLTTRYMFWCTDPLLNDIEGEGGYRNYGKAGKSGGNGGDGGFLRAIIVSNDEKLQFTESDYLEFETSRGKKGIPGNVGPDSLAGPGGDGRDADAYNACPQPVVGSRPQYKDKSGPPVSPDFAKDGIAPEKIITVQTYSRSWWPFTD